MSMIAAVVGRILLGALFIVSGLNKIVSPGTTAQYIESTTTLPGYLAMPTGVFELVAGLLLMVGLMTRLVAVLLAGFVLLTVFFFHNDLRDPVQMTEALKNLAIVGGLLAVFAYGQMRGTYDHLRTVRRADKAELRAAHAEGVAEGTRHDTTTVVTDVNRDGVPEVRKRRWW
ncbi:MAG: hypothetical protein B7Z08_08425 [Sphingomonadales bacterium 32-68-7]|nr:MAG: hypothetical protein B7Z33_09570 [Sphingomonadales bacterium 12-68-11]OYX08659.1 MAG: hypothetical protein B7Z08_08425 [Sphingomonadales bacterium 32-68-7]